MRIPVGHFLFPIKPNEEDTATKRIRLESHNTPIHANSDGHEKEKDCLSTARITDTLQGIVAGMGEATIVPEVHLHTGRGASFCFLKGFLASALATPTDTAVPIPVDAMEWMCQRVCRIPRFNEIRLSNTCVVPVFWEEHIMEDFSAEISSQANGAERLLRSRVLVIGAGGIGCEVLKVLALCGFQNIDIFDLDTIDATNLNRQFLFRTEDVGASKAKTAQKALLEWFPDNTLPPKPTIEAHHDDIKSPLYDEAFFAQFAIVLSALDNVSARQHVNRMCMRGGVPLIESGTMGYNGQVQPIILGEYECYDCHQKAAGTQTIAVCTIHARPTTMVHCVHYAKELYERLFGESHSPAVSGAGDELAFVDAIMAQQSAHHSEATHHSLNEVQRLRGLAMSLASSLFHQKVKELLAMKSAWPTQPPTPLEDSLLLDFSKRALREASTLTQHPNRDDVPSVEVSLALFVDATVQCAQRGPVRLPFRKEDNDTVDFVAATANLRATVFHIPKQSVEDIRSIAGAIVPAIATTNAIIAAAVVQQAFCVLERSYQSLLPSDYVNFRCKRPQVVFARRAPQVRRRRGGSCKGTDLFLVHSTEPSKPNPSCIVCGNVSPTVRVELDMSRVSVGAFVRLVLERHTGMLSPTIYNGSRIIYDEDFTDFVDKRLVDFLGVKQSLELIVDDACHDVEWRFLVRHQPRSSFSSCCVISSETDGGEDVMTVEGIEEANRAEQHAKERKAKAVTVQENEAGNHLVPNSTSKINSSSSDHNSAKSMNGKVIQAVVVIDSDNEVDNKEEEIIEID